MLDDIDDLKKKGAGAAFPTSIISGGGGGLGGGGIAGYLAQFLTPNTITNSLLYQDAQKFLFPLPVDLQNLSLAPGNPAVGFIRLYPKSDKRLYYRDSTGTEIGPLVTSAANVVPISVVVWGTSTSDGFSYSNFFSFGGRGIAADETFVQSQVPSGIISNLRTKIYNPTANSVSLTLRRNGVNTTLGVVCSPNSGLGTILTDNTHTVAVATGDLVDWYLQTAAGSIGVGAVSCFFTSTVPPP
jgi:hypothetical protein